MWVVLALAVLLPQVLHILGQGPAAVYVLHDLQHVLDGPLIVGRAWIVPGHLQQVLEQVL